MFQKNQKKKKNVSTLYMKFVFFMYMKTHIFITVLIGTILMETIYVTEILIYNII